MIARGGGALIREGRLIDMLAQGGRGGLTRGRALIRVWALIRGNTLLRNFGGKLWEMQKW